MIDKPYTVEFNGDCMGGLIEAGEWLEAVPGDDIHVLDLVSVLLSTFTGPWGPFVNALSDEGLAGLVKIALGSFETNGETVYLFGQLNPPTVVPIPSSAIAGIHRIDFQGEAKGSDLEALELLNPFAGVGIENRKAA